MSNLPVLAAAGLAPAPIDLIAAPPTTTSSVDSWTVHLGPVTATISYEHDNNCSTVYVPTHRSMTCTPGSTNASPRLRR